MAFEDILQCFPLDNTLYEAKHLGAYLGTRTRGVYSAEDNLRVKALGTMDLEVNAGRAWLQINEIWGTVVFLESTAVLTVKTAHTALNRKDAVCLRINKNTNAPELLMKEGPLSTSTDPALPEITRDANFDEIYLYSVYVPAGAVSVSASNLSDLRTNETYCGIMRDGVTGIPTADLIRKFNDLLQNLEDKSNLTIEDLKSVFSDFMAHLHNELDENQAANLLNLIDALNNALDAANAKIDELELTKLAATLFFSADKATLFKMSNRFLIQTGFISITPTAANTPTSKALTFDVPYESTPAVLANAETGTGGTQVTGCYANSTSKTGTSIVLTRTNIVATGCVWFAIGKAAE